MQTSRAMKAFYDFSTDDVSDTIDIHDLFVAFDRELFSGALGAVELKWSSRMTLCAGVCKKTREGIVICLSEPLLKFRTVTEMRETLLHEMIHAYIFVNNISDSGPHGHHYVRHMNRINNITGLNITVYHDFHLEVDFHRTHVWRCNGICQNEAPYYGYVKRAMNRPPGKYDYWWGAHQLRCGGTYDKLAEPAPRENKKKRRGAERDEGSDSLERFLPSLNASSSKRPCPVLEAAPPQPSRRLEWSDK
eukprot:GHVU01023954.1.p1 GENE.GHVU01023954.1~~GHVU01023954.1.p1  ORF type:complete len:248 (-),score=15.11 GHVU01023954.1:440-1183(-)